MKQTQTGLMRLSSVAKEIKGNVGYLCHPASVDQKYTHGIEVVKEIFGDRLKKLFSPQHGIFAEVQDNMIESDHFVHGHYQLPVYSLYSDTRKPSPEMLEGLDHVLVDLQDVGTRVYTYIYTMTYMMETCAENNVEVIILDRPNPIGGDVLEGNLLDMSFRSFVGRYPLPMRHGLTMGEVAIMAKKYWDLDCDLRVIEMEGWSRNMNYWDTKLPWVLPSPNLPNIETSFTFVGTVIFEGTNISEGRGSTKSLETVGHPDLKNLELLKKLNTYFSKEKLAGFILRPVSFIPTFQKHVGVLCHGYQIHVTDFKLFKPWLLGQVLCQFFYHELGEGFSWKQPPYEYEETLLPIDILNGSDKVRLWVESKGDYAELLQIEKEGMSEFAANRKEILLY